MAPLLYMPEFSSTIMLESSCLFLITIIIFYLIFVLFYNTASEKQEFLVLYNRPLSGVKRNSHSVTDNLQFNT